MQSLASWGASALNDVSLKVVFGCICRQCAGPRRPSSFRRMPSMAPPLSSPTRRCLSISLCAHHGKIQTRFVQTWGHAFLYTTPSPCDHLPFAAAQPFQQSWTLKQRATETASPWLLLKALKSLVDCMPIFPSDMRPHQLVGYHFGGKFRWWAAQAELHSEYS